MCDKVLAAESLIRVDKLIFCSSCRQNFAIVRIVSPATQAKKERAELIFPLVLSMERHFEFREVSVQDVFSLFTRSHYETYRF